MKAQVWKKPQDAVQTFGAKNVDILKNNWLCIVADKNKHQVYQVCWQLDRHNKDREFNGLAEAMQFFSLKKGKLITYNEEDSYAIKGVGKVEIIPFWKWMSK